MASRTHDEKLTSGELRYRFDQLFAETKWKVLRGWHVLRHSFISCCAYEGVDSRLIKSWVGHAEESTHRRYARIYPHKEAEAIALVFG